jgi:LmbE family N-acetylglucosaminyl deacetylase
MATKPHFVLTIFRDAMNPIHIACFATVEQAIEQGEQWRGRLWWRVTKDGRTVAEEPLGVKR